MKPRVLDRPTLTEMPAPAVGPAQLLDLVEVARIEESARLTTHPERRAELGQYFTPAIIAEFMAGMLDAETLPRRVGLLDAGGGNGMLTAAVVAKLCSLKRSARPAQIDAVVWEIDGGLAPSIRRTLALCEQVAESTGVTFNGEVRSADFIREATRAIGQGTLFGSEPTPHFDVAILNPPYRKLRSNSDERRWLSEIGIETSNLYSGFVWLAMELLQPGGQLVAITPRSYMNGSYFRPFRQALTRSMSFRRVHVYDRRDTAFGADEVLQENAIIHTVKTRSGGEVLVTTSHGPNDHGLVSRSIAADQFIQDGDRDAVMHVVPDENEAQISERMRALPQSLGELGVEVSTGRVVDFRARDRLAPQISNGEMPLVFPRHFAEGFVAWPSSGSDKPNAIHPRHKDDRDLFPSGWYVVIKRFSAKEEKRRVVAAVFDPERIPHRLIGFDNKLNVLHAGGGGLPPRLAKGLALFLNSGVVDAYFRQFSGHTQVNAGDLRSLRFPARDVLERLGAHVNGRMPDEEEINRLVREEIPSMTEGADPIAAKTRVEAVIGILKAINAPKEQRNERSALTLLALLDLPPEAPWTQAQNPLRGVTEVMDWMAAHYGKKYAPNTRETVRRFTLHQFIEMGLVILNPDNPERPPNSPKNVYQIEPSAMELVRTFGTDDWAKNVDSYNDSMHGKNRLREAARQMKTIPVTLPDGQTIELSAGGQNVLIKEIVEQFAPRFTPGGHVAYIGDAGEKHLVYDEPYLAKLGVVIDRHGKMPDVVIHFKDRNWLVLVEAVTSHGPVNMLRHTQLKDLFTGSTAGLVFVTAFLDRQAMREYLPEIAWETEVWVADAPSHLIHFNGERFLGPYDH